MLLTIDHIKKIDKVLDVEGFKLVAGCIVCPTGLQASYQAFKDETKMAFPLYLVRVIEAINKMEEPKYYIILDTYVTIYDEWGEQVEDFEQLPITDEAKEKAIIYILDHIGD